MWTSIYNGKLANQIARLVAIMVKIFTYVASVRLDKISVRLLKDSVDVITPSLTNLQINIVNYLHECELQ